MQNKKLGLHQDSLVYEIIFIIYQLLIKELHTKVYNPGTQN